MLPLATLWWWTLILALSTDLAVAHNVLFVKVYKTASSTVAGVLWRYANEHNKTVHPGIFKHCKPRSYAPVNIFLGHNYCGPRGCSTEQKRGGHCRGIGLQRTFNI